MEDKRKMFQFLMAVKALTECRSFELLPVRDYIRNSGRTIYDLWMTLSFYWNDWAEDPYFTVGALLSWFDYEDEQAAMPEFEEE